MPASSDGCRLTCNRKTILNYTNVTPEKKFGIVIIKSSPRTDVITFQVSKKSLEEAPLKVRIGVCLSLLFFRLATNDGEICLNSVLNQEMAGTGGGSNEFDSSDFSSEKQNAPDFTEAAQKARTLINNTIEFVQKQWPFDFEVAQSILPNREAALYLIANRPMSDTDLAYATDGACGFLRELGVTSAIGARPMATQTEIPKDPVALVQSILSGEAIGGIDVVNFATSEADFPVTTK